MITFHFYYDTITKMSGTCYELRSFFYILLVSSHFLGFISRYKVVQIWPVQAVTCLHTNSPGHIWTTLYFP
jgi:hypothetical protein